MPIIHFATTNSGKLQWLERVLEMEGLSGEWAVKSCPMELIEIQSADIHEISLHKARQAFEKLQQPVLTMDGGFYIKALNGFPGPFGKYMFEQMGVELGKVLAQNIISEIQQEPKPARHDSSTNALIHFYLK